LSYSESCSWQDLHALVELGGDEGVDWARLGARGLAGAQRRLEAAVEEVLEEGGDARAVERSVWREDELALPLDLGVFYNPYVIILVL
jgi:hypothetical protein